MTLAQYAARARAAHAAAEAAPDPRDKAAYRSAAQTWERLAKPKTDTWSLLPERLSVEALKRDIATAIDAPAPTPAVAAVVTASMHGVKKALRVNRPMRAETVSMVEEYLNSRIEF